jgi:hypothetical protein
MMDGRPLSAALWQLGVFKEVPVSRRSAGQTNKAPLASMLANLFANCDFARGFLEFSAAVSSRRTAG